MADFDRALAALREWDRECREAHAEHMAAIAELQEAFRPFEVDRSLIEEKG